MTLDPFTYSINVPTIHSWIDAKLALGPLDYLGEPGYIALATSVPIVVVDYYIGEMLGWPVEMREKMERDMMFYHVDQVIGYVGTEGEREV